MRSMVNVGRSTMTRRMASPSFGGSTTQGSLVALPVRTLSQVISCTRVIASSPSPCKVMPSCTSWSLLLRLSPRLTHLSSALRHVLSALLAESTRLLDTFHPAEATHEATPLPPPPPIDGEDDDVPSASLASTGRVVPDSDLDMSTDLGQAIACPPAFLPRLKNAPRRRRRGATRTMTHSRSGSQSEETRKNMVSVLWQDTNIKSLSLMGTQRGPSFTSFAPTLTCMVIHLCTLLLTVSTKMSQNAWCTFECFLRTDGDAVFTEFRAGRQLSNGPNEYRLTCNNPVPSS
ncbi:hypothetical protein EDB89DRAFT_884603 [Lactarius sanguifluus]|nr:hypothetical protein EDB89DRAFT_884603 [Lactarius sanguifluus]